MLIRHRLNAAAPAYSLQMPPKILAKYRYRRRLPHLQKSDADLFVTFCAGGPFILPPAARDLVFEHCLREGALRPWAPGSTHPVVRIQLHAAVIMPNHVHLLLQPLRHANGWPYPLVDILQCLKSTTAHRINKLLDRSGPVWEEESFDHLLRSDESLQQKAEYIRQNPVRRGLVERPEDYKWLWISPELQNVARGPSPA
jgi:REP element-mobilizing transposase RayT